MLRRTIATSEALCSKCRLHNYEWFGGMMLCCRSTSEIQRRDAPLLDCKVGGTILQVPIKIVRRLDVPFDCTKGAMLLCLIARSEARCPRS